MDVGISQIVTVTESLTDQLLITFLSVEVSVTPRNNQNYLTSFEKQIYLQQALLWSRRPSTITTAYISTCNRTSSRC